MYPHVELQHLALRKTILRHTITVRREACASAAQKATTPLLWLDRAVALIQRAAPWLPFLSAPLGLFIARKSAAKPSLIRSVMKWAPLAFQVTRFASSAFSHRKLARR